eukprot:gene6594-7339_t
MESFVHIDQSSFEDAFSQLTKFRLNGDFCDVTLKIAEEHKDVEFRAHRVILASRSIYFYTMFASNLLESREEVIKLNGVTLDAFRQLISYAYTGKIDIKPGIIEELLEAAHMFQFESVQDACFEFLRNNIDCANCIGIAYLAEKYHCKKAHRDAQEFSRQNFRAVSKTKEFAELDYKQVYQLISNDELNVTHESEVYAAMVGWVKRDEKQRGKYLAQLLQCLRVPLLTRKFLIDILAKEEMVMVNPDCRKFLLQALDYHLVPERREQNQVMQVNPREIFTKKILVIGGENRSGVLKTVECYDVTKYYWETKTSLPQGRKYASAILLDGLVYVAGGKGHDREDLNTVDKYDPTTDQWASVAKLQECKGAVSLAVLEGWLYALGGSQGGSALKTVERYDPVLNIWTHVQPMRFPRSHFGTAAYAGRLHAVGGYCGISEIEHCEVYDPNVNRWKDMADLNKARMNHGVIVHSDRIFAIGDRARIACWTR